MNQANVVFYRRSANKKGWEYLTEIHHSWDSATTVNTDTVCRVSWQFATDAAVEAFWNRLISALPTAQDSWKMVYLKTIDVAS